MVLGIVLAAPLLLAAAYAIWYNEVRLRSEQRRDRFINECLWMADCERWRKEERERFGRELC